MLIRYVEKVEVDSLCLTLETNTRKGWNIKLHRKGNHAWIIHNGTEVLKTKIVFFLEKIISGRFIRISIWNCHQMAAICRDRRRSWWYSLISFPARSLLARTSRGCLYRYITALPTPELFNESDEIGGNWKKRNVYQQRFHCPNVVSVVQPQLQTTDNGLR